MILQLSNYRYREHPAEHVGNMAFWRAVRQFVGPLHVVGRAPVRRVQLSEVDQILFTLFPSASNGFSFIHKLKDWLFQQENLRLVWNSDPIVTPLAVRALLRRKQVPWLLELQQNVFGSATALSIKHFLGQKIAITAARSANCIRVCARSHADELIRLQIPPERIAVIPTRVDVSQFDPDALHKPLEEIRFQGASDVLIIGVGTLVRRKGFQHAIEALRCLPSEAKLVIVGDGPERGELEGLSNRCGLSSRVQFLGQRNYRDMPQILATADILVLPSHNEGMPRVINEALAMRLPVVASAIDGISEQVLHGETGFLCKPGQPQALAQALLPLVQSESLRDQMGTLGRTHVLNHFSSTRVMQHWHDTLNRIVRQ